MATKSKQLSEKELRKANARFKKLCDQCDATIRKLRQADRALKEFEAKRSGKQEPSINPELFKIKAPKK
jgi:hypothetical protein